MLVIWPLQRWLILRDIDPVYWWLTRSFPCFMGVVEGVRGFIRAEQLGDEA